MNRTDLRDAIKRDIGEIGTPERDKFERELAKEIHWARFNLWLRRFFRLRDKNSDESQGGQFPSDSDVVNAIKDQLTNNGFISE